MNRLEDMGRFPLPVYLGATANILAEIAFFYWLHARLRGSFPAAFVAATILVVLNVLPVILLRAAEGPASLRNTPPVEQMNFFRDQHRFSTWVTAVASGNLFFWLMLAWAAFDVAPTPRLLLGVELLAFFCTLLPLWLRLLRPSRVR